MNKTQRPFAILCILLLICTLLFACSSKEQGGKTAETSAPATEAAAVPEATTRSYTDYKGHSSEIPVKPQRIIYSGETYGDLTALGVQAIGYPLSMGEGQVFEDKLTGVEDVGFPINLEKTLELQPDLIIYAGVEEADYEALSKIAPTIIFNTFAPLKERMLELGDILGKKPEAEAWIANYLTKEEAMWSQLKASGMKDGETASVFTYYPGDRLFVMATTGLSQVLYGEQGFKPTPAIQQVLDADMGFQEISMELLQEYAGDRIFLLTPVAEEAKQSTDKLQESAVWKSLPAVKNGFVYTQDIMKSSSDATTREWLLSELPAMLGKQ